MLSAIQTARFSIVEEQLVNFQTAVDSDEVSKTGWLVDKIE